MRRGRTEVGNQLRFLLLILTVALSPLVNPVMGGTSMRELRRSGQTRSNTTRGPSFSPRAVSLPDTKSNSLNSTRNTRQTPEIPALYSAPKNPTPDIPALYSAPKINPESQNEVDSSSPDQGRATTEVSMEEEADFSDESTSDDYEYGVPTERSSNPNGPNQEDESLGGYPTDSPSATSRTNEADHPMSDYNESAEDEDTYGSGRSNPDQEPSSQYGPPSQPGSPAQPGREKEKMGKKTKGNRPRDQQQTENNLEPSSQTEQPNEEMDEEEMEEGEEDPESFYLPPLYTNPQEEQQQPQPPQQQTDNGADSQSHYDGDFDPYQQPPNPNYKTLPPQNNGMEEANGHSGGQNFNTRPHDLSKERSSSGFPQQQQMQMPQSHSQGHAGQGQQQHFGNSLPSSLYGPPGVNHLDSGKDDADANAGEDELEGLDEKIVDAELLDRVHQIIEDHENQQKLQLEGIQKNNEKSSSAAAGSGYSSSSDPPPYAQVYSGNELSSGPSGFSSPGSAYPGGYNSYRPSSGSDNGAAPAPQYGPPSFSSSGYTGSNSVFQQGSRDGTSQSRGGEAYKASQPGSSRKDDANRSGPSQAPSSSSQPQPAGGYDSSGGQEGRENELKKSFSSSPDVEYQKAILSTHFTESEPDPEQGGSQGYGTSQNSGYKLNSFAGPGQEYLPPADNGRGEGPGRNSQNGGGYSKTFSSGDYAARAQNQNSVGERPRDPNNFSVQVGAGIKVGSVSPEYGPPAASQALPTRQQQDQTGSRQSNPPRQDASFLPGASKEGKPGGRNEQGYPSPNPQQQSPGFWSRSQLPPEPQTRYGPPSPNREPKPSGFFPSGPSGSDNNALGHGNPNSQSSQQQYSAPQPTHTAPVENPSMVSIPRPIYGVPLAPVITLDSGSSPPSYYPSSTPFSFDRGQQTATPSGSYLPPPSSSQYSSGNDDLASRFHFPTSSSSNDVIYGILENNQSPSASSSSYLSVQGQNGNSNDHIYNINHNGYGSSFFSSGSSGSFAASSSRSSVLAVAHPWHNGVDDGSPIIPGISNTFTLPIYDYSPGERMMMHQLFQNDPRVGASSSTSPVVLPFQQFLEQMQIQLPLGSHSNNVPSLTTTTAGGNLPGIIYGSAKGHDKGFRVSRRALSKQASISSATTAPNSNLQGFKTRAGTRPIRNERENFRG